MKKKAKEQQHTRRISRLGNVSKRIFDEANDSNNVIKIPPISGITKWREAKLSPLDDLERLDLEGKGY